MVNEFKPGDLVRFRSGSPKLTVHSEDAATGSVIVQWFHDNAIHTATVKPCVLEAYPAPSMGCW